MFNSIEQIQRKYTTAVQPIKLFETKNNSVVQKSTFDFIEQLKKSGHNPFHPDISNSNNGRKLDILS